jgi:RecB family exonuclease
LSVTEVTKANTPRLIVGPPAALEHALAAEISRAKGGDPLTPVTILVGNTLLRPYLQRRLADPGLLGGHINLEIVTFADLALKLGEPAMLAGKRLPVPALAGQVIARQVAAGAKGYFKPVAQAPGFAAALQRLFGELRQAGVGPADLAGSAPEIPDNERKAAGLATLYESHEAQRQGFYDPTDALAAADPGLLGSGAVIVHGISYVTALQASLLERLAVEAPIVILLPATGTDADQAHADLRAWLASVGVTIEAAPESGDIAGESAAHTAGDTARDSTQETDALRHLQSHLFTHDEGAPPDGSVHLVSAPDAPREVVEAARACMDWAREGIAFHEMAVAYRNDDPYRALIESIFDDSGIPIYLHDGTPLAERPLGRRALGLLDLIDPPRPLLRSSVMGWLADASVPSETWDRYGGVHAARWDEISRDAGIVEGREQWKERLDAYRADQEERRAKWLEREGAKEGNGDDPEPDGFIRRIESAERLDRFVSDLADRLDARPARATWAGHLEYLRGLFHKYLRGAEPILDELAALEQLDSPPGGRATTEPTFEQFRATAREAIASMRAEDLPDKPRGRFQRQGVNVLDTSSLQNLRFRAVAILGMTERSFPPPPRQDALLLDHERALLNDARGWQIPPRAKGPDREPLQFALAVNAATDRLQLSFARTNAGDARAKLPSYFFRAAAASLSGRLVTVDDVDGLPADFFSRVRGSRFAAPPHEQARALTPSEYDRTLLLDEPALGLACANELRPEIRRSREAHHARWRLRKLTSYDGVLTEASAAGLAERDGLGRVLSPSSLETYATCPYRYFMSRVLGVKKLEDPDRIERIEARDRGSLVHEILEKFLIGIGDADRPSAERRAAHLARLREIAAEEFTKWEEQGRTGLPVLWDFDRRMISQDLERWYDEELGDPDHFDHGKFELRFGKGKEEDDPLEIAVDGVRLRFAGIIDRLEWTKDRSAFRVIDYKTGWADRRLKDGHLKNGRALQLPLYVRAGAAHLGIPPERGSAQYFYVSAKGGFKRTSFTGEELKDRAADLELVLGTLATGIGEGRFQQVPGPDSKNCRYCDYAVVCDARITALAERKATDPVLKAFTKLEEIA